MNAKPGDVYYLATGAAGEKRLALLEEVYGPELRASCCPSASRVAMTPPCSWPRHLRVGAVAVGLQPRRLDFHPD